jgi:hypothetical protein
MAALSTIALLGGLALGATSTAIQVKQGQDAKKAERVAERERKTLLGEQAAAEDHAKANDSRARQAGELQRRRAASGSGRPSTLLTGSAGLTDQAPTQRKTLLGM